MDKKKSKTYSAGELARKFGVTIRTIQYYDKKNILKAEFKSNGRRTYNDNDVLRLQQILFLKSFGFSLDEIRDRLLKENSTKEVKQIFEQQKIALTKKIMDLQKVVSMLNKTIEEMDTGCEININRLVAMMSLISQQNSYRFVLDYFDNSQLPELMIKLVDTQSNKKFSDENKIIIMKLIKLYRSGATPDSAEGQQFAEQWWNMVNQFTDGNASLLKTLFSAGFDVNNWPDEVKEFKDAVTNFLMDALAIYLKNKGIEWPERRDQTNE